MKVKIIYIKGQQNYNKVYNYEWYDGRIPLILYIVCPLIGRLKY